VSSIAAKRKCIVLADCFRVEERGSCLGSDVSGVLSLFGLAFVYYGISHPQCEGLHTKVCTK